MVCFRELLLLVGRMLHAGFWSVQLLGRIGTGCWLPVVKLCVRMVRAGPISPLALLLPSVHAADCCCVGTAGRLVQSVLLTPVASVRAAMLTAALRLVLPTAAVVSMLLSPAVAWEGGDCCCCFRRSLQ